MQRDRPILTLACTVSSIGNLEIVISLSLKPIIEFHHNQGHGECFSFLLCDFKPVSLLLILKALFLPNLNIHEYYVTLS